jgi:DNA-binding NarL/FixJ family response regulator
MVSCLEGVHTERMGGTVRTVLVCVRTPLAAQSVASCAARLGVFTLRTAVSEAEVLARLAEQPAELILADTTVTRPDTVGFTRRVLGQAPQAVLVLFGAEEPNAAAASVAAGARGVIRGGDHDLVGTVAKALLLIGSARAPAAQASGATTPARAARQVGGVLAGAGKPRAVVAATDGRSRTGKDITTDRAPEGTRTGPAADQGRDRAMTRAPGADDGTGSTLVPVQRGDQVTDGDQSSPARSTAIRLRAPLTERELQVLRGMADGKSNAEIGRDLYVSEDTVKTHARRLFRKIGARDRANAVAMGFRTGILP